MSMAKRYPGGRDPLMCTARTSASLMIWTTLTPTLGALLHDTGREPSPSSSSLHLRQRCLGLGQPEGHVHGVVQRDSGRQLGAGQLSLAGRGIQRAQAEVAVGLERAHTEFVGQD